MNNLDFKARNRFNERISKGLLGPGSDNWGLPDKEEIISDYPLIRYFTGVLFPPKSNILTQSELDDAETENETSNEDNDNETTIIKSADINEENTFNPNPSKEDELKISYNNFFPTNIALSFCLEESVKAIDVEFSFGSYYQPNYKQKKIKISKTGFDSFFYSKIPYQPSFLDKLEYNNGFMYLNKKFEGYVGGGSKQRSGDYVEYDKFRQWDNLKDCPATKSNIHILEKLLGRAWKRKDIKIVKRIAVRNMDNLDLLELPDDISNKINVGYYTKVYSHQTRKYMKIQFVNCSDEQPANKFSNKNEVLNLKCLFQTKIKISSKNFLPFKTQNESMPFDREAERLNFIYRDVNNFAIGHNCSVTWYKHNNKRFIETTFLPKTNVEEIKNNLDEIEDQQFNQALDIKNLSSFGKSQKEVISDLKHFISFYDKWIIKQTKLSSDLSKNQDIANDIISKQKKNFERIYNNINLLKDENIFKVFQITNLAMLIQIIISNDNDFAGKEKELNELNETEKYNDVNYFREYDYAHNLGFNPKYRPFQLAFLLLSLDGIIDKQSDFRNDIVDLIWFPTGGGKTEAYLAVAAFTIIWRRYSNESDFEGTCVIMRYTLRLLTAQQFERASRLIIVLEFLRNLSEFKFLLKDEPITIGQWIGMASTPNKLEEAKQKINAIDNECDKKNGNPQDKNVFQISSCPWCGTKLITKDNEIWDYGFEVKKTDFIIYCLNDKCPFHNRIPVQVVDEILYKTPPTLLFGTVDKFAMLSWKPEGYIFFNTHDENKLPPELIIQDELHLLNGPLGSITGLFENVIELLCLRNGVRPKIIASTATTRNTEKQIEQLYGNKEVNIFPPQGLSYTDSFFAKIDKLNRKRMYVGFMPTGKTIIDTQLHLLSHLLVARIEVYSDGEIKPSINDYWTIVSYFNSLKDVGKISNKVGDEISSYTEYLQNRLFNNLNRFNYLGLSKRTKELTSRIQSEKIKSTLNEISENLNEKKFNVKDGNKYLNDVVDLVLATNMISVGIDVSRLNIMLINGMPRNVAEYIQASSRIGRNNYGLVVTLLNANNAREKSFFEHFIPFHKSFYKYIEPLSVTSFTENTIDKMLTSLMISFIRQYYPGELGDNNQAQYFSKDKLHPFINHLKERYVKSKSEFSYFLIKINKIANDWEKRIENYDLKKYSELIKNPSEKDESNIEWIVMQSMREIDTSTFIQIKED
ncbi:MAG: helicase C-terminal domain-containing protein [Melioribacteraceae bacterium]|nr:helicase C-terminal domain-containing protein [Melioribacteraceae bacterium]